MLHICNKNIHNYQYEIYEFLIPFALQNKIKFLKKWFRNEKDVPIEFRRRKIVDEFIESGLIILSRLTEMIEKDIPLISGSRWLGKKPWAFFGDISVGKAKKIFKTKEELVSKYRSQIECGDTLMNQYFYFRVEPTIAFELAEKYQEHPNYIISLSICLLYDILINCGPDCQEIADLFCNDKRIKDVDLLEWERHRQKTMGSKGKILSKPNVCWIGQFYIPSVELKSSTKFDELSNSLDIYDNEKHLKVFLPPPEDDSLRLQEWLARNGSDPRLKEYAHLFNPNDSEIFEVLEGIDDDDDECDTDLEER